jgi:hypothetical protein
MKEKIVSIAVAACLIASSAFAQEYQIVPALNRCGGQLGQLAAQNYSLAEQLDRVTAERDALKKQIETATPKQQ